MYISRAAIPSTKHGPFESVMKQVCIYALPKKELNTFGEISKKTPLEDNEDIEILRLLETGVKVKMVEVSTSSIAVDVPSDIDKIKLFSMTLDLAGYKYIVFDCDGVILDSNQIKTDAFTYALSSYKKSEINKLISYHKKWWSFRYRKFNYFFKNILENG